MCKPGALPDKRKTPSLAEVRAAIPPHCFQHSLPRALLLVLRDGLMLAALFLVARASLRLPGGEGGALTLLEWAGWAVYAFAQGTVAVGWWVLAHECGHGGFSNYRTLNDAVGWVLHSLLLVPYFSWQYSHGKHHAKTNHLLDGETHVPETRQDMTKIGFRLLYNLLGDTGFAVWQLISHLVLGWPLYLIMYTTGGRRLNGEEIAKPVPFPHVVDHFRPGSVLFPPTWRRRVALSTLGVALTFAALGLAARSWGWQAVALYYGAPYLWVNFWLVLYTWLQHTDPEMPHYGDEDWTWMKGALCTIDRPYMGFDWFHHHIGSTHVCHHIFSSLPCYHAVEATEHLRAFLEPLGFYNYDDTPWPAAAWRVAKSCHFVEDVHGTQYYKAFSAQKHDKVS